MRNTIIGGAIVAATLAAAPATAATLDDVKTRGHLLCGVNEGLVGFAEQKNGAWAGFDVDFCRAVAAAVFGDGSKVEFVPLSASARFGALKDGSVDILSRNSTWTISRELDYGITFVGTTYYDGQGFMLARAANILSALELGGQKVCAQDGTTTLSNLEDFFKLNNMAYEVVVTTSAADSLAKYTAGDCTVVTSDMSQLYASRSTLPDSAEHVILADAISREPLGPAVRAADPAWVALVKWVHFALLDAEELGVASYNLDVAQKSEKPDVKRLLGRDAGYGEQLGVANDWVLSMVKAVGNYGEVFERNLGSGSPLGIPRGMNQLWSRGGIQYAPPFR